MSLPVGWAIANVNLPGPTPATIANMSGTVLTIVAGGAQIGNGATDSFGFVWFQLSGDWDVSCRVVQAWQSGDSGDSFYSQGSILGREDNTSGSRQDYWGLAQGDGARGRIRKTTSASDVSNGSDATPTPPYYIRNVRTHDATHTYFDHYRSTDGISWGSALGGDNIPALIDPMNVGFGAHSLDGGGTGQTSTIIMDNIYINGVLQNFTSGSTAVGSGNALLVTLKERIRRARLRQWIRPGRIWQPAPAMA